MSTSRIHLIVLLLAVYSVTSGNAQADPSLPDRISEVDEDDLILLNVAAKGRVVELLANELARTEIIRALLLEYARECAHNVSVLETHCIDCMMDRCSNRLLECGIELPPLSEVMSHQRSPIKGLQFLSKPPAEVDSHLDRFIKIARPDILKGVPKSLEKKAEKIVEEEVDQSLKDLVDNRDTDTALKKIKIHEKDDKNNVKKESDRNGMVVVINHMDHGESVADILRRNLQRSRPLLEKLTQHSSRVAENMPSVMEQLGAHLDDFRLVVGGVFSNMMDNFQASMNQPNTALVNGNGQQMFPPNMNQQQAFASQNNIPQGPMAQNSQFKPGQFNRGQFMGQSQFQQNQMFNAGGIPSNQIPQMPNALAQPAPTGARPGGQSQFFQQQNAIIANPAIRVPGPTPMFQNQMAQGQGQMSQGQNFPAMQPGIPQGQWTPQGQSQGQTIQNNFQGQNFQGQFQGQNGNGQNLQEQNFQGQSQGPNFQGQSMGQNGQGQSNQQSFQGQNFQTQSKNQNFQGNSQNGPQGQMQGNRGPQGSRFQVTSQRRRKRDLVNCVDLKKDPDTYCRQFESQCYNCTLEKRLRFEVCGDGVERARDEIKRLDTSVDKYLETFDNFIVGSRLILKIELNDRNRLHKSDSYEDAFITAKIGPSIIRFQSKMVLNINNIRVSGSQIGDELWEKLWHKEVFKEAERVKIPPKKDDIMGQTHNLLKPQKDSEQSARHSSGGNTGSTKFVSMVTLTLSIAVSVLVYFM